MSGEDPRTTIKNKLSDAQNGVSLKKDDGQTAADVEISFEYAEDLLEAHDVIITIGHREDRQRYLGLGASLRHVVATYKVGVWTRDKTGITGSRILWDGVKEVTRVVGAAAKNPGGILKWWKLAQVMDEPRVDVRPPFYHSALVIEAHRVSGLEDP